MDSLFDPAALLRSARTRNGLTQRALAERAGTAQSVVARIEGGQSSPTVATLNRLIEAAGCRVEARLVPTAEGFRSRAVTFFEKRAPRGLIAAYLFGSTAHGARHLDSDVDVAVLLDRERYPTATERAELRVRLVSDLVEALRTNEVDLVVLNDVPPGLAARIVLDGVPLAVFDREQAHDFARDVQLRRADLAPFLDRARRLKREALAR